MKVGIGMLEFLTVFLVLSLKTEAVVAVEPEAVVDKQGEAVRAGVGYYVWPLWADDGGLTLGQTRNKTCPLDVIRDPSFIGTPVSFLGPAHGVIQTLTDLTIEFKVRTICNQPTVWRLSKEGSGFWFVSTSGKPEDITSKFKIERLEGEHAYEIYSFKFCPSVPGTLCAPVGTFVDSDGTKVMAVGDNIEPYYVRFQKVFYDREVATL
ncbi:hypothetical protein CR513_14484, partial [Mucuna pruriens]